ncbi:MAG: hypothetical protein GF331_25200 [Chitinivibrionales bacterium]|nr:hypothetical protein [Chitinivibrionales bacterium]
MVTQRDMRVLSRHRTRTGKTVEWIVTLAPFALIVLANLNLHLSAQMADNSGRTFGELVGIWLNGVENGQRYLGSFVIAIELFRTAVIQAISALVLAGMAYLYIAGQRMHERILQTIENLGDSAGDTDAHESDRDS